MIMMGYEDWHVKKSQHKRVYGKTPPAPEDYIALEYKPPHESFFIFHRREDNGAYELVELTPDIIRKLLR